MAPPLSPGGRGHPLFGCETATVTKVTKIIGQEWVDRHPDRFTGFDPPTPHPCIICGAPKGDCTPHDGVPDAPEEEG